MAKDVPVVHIHKYPLKRKKEIKDLNKKDGESISFRLWTDLFSATKAKAHIGVQFHVVGITVFQFFQTLSLDQIRVPNVGHIPHTSKTIQNILFQ